MNPTDAIERDVRAFLDENFILDPAAPPLAGDASLTALGVLDSMGVLELIDYLEDRFDVTVPDEDAVPANLDSVVRIVRYVEMRSEPELGGTTTEASWTALE